MFAKVFTAAIVATAAQTAFAGACTRKYTAQAGDICDNISAAHNVSTYQLAVINAGVIDDKCGNLQPGTEYCLGYENEDCNKTYVVQKDDTCEMIASKNNINATMVHLNNPQIEAGCGNVYIGEVLCVAETVIVPPAPQGAKPAATIPATAAAAATSQAQDDDDLPFCDEL